MYKICWLFFFVFIWQNAFTQCLNGSYTVGNGGDYTTLQDAVNDLDANGSCGPVRFNIKPGAYTGKVVFPASLNLSASNALTVSGSQSGTTRLYDNPSSLASNNYVFKIDGTGYITFKNLQIDRGIGSGNYATVVSFANNASNIAFDSCSIIGIKTSLAGTINKVLMYFDSTLHENIEITNCTLYGGSNGIYYSRTSSVSKASGWIVKNNKITDVTEAAVYLTHLKNLKIIRNNIQLVSTSASLQLGLYLSDCENKIEIKSNLIIQNKGTVLSLNKLANTGGVPAEVYNNVFNSVGNSNTGIIINTVSNLLFYHNTVKQPNAATAITCSQSTGLKIINNIVYGGKFSLDIDSVSSLQASNFNNWTSSSGSGIFKRLKDTLKNVSAWGAYSGLDNSSISLDVYFTSNELDITGENLFINNKGTYLNEVKEDILGNSRSKSTPDIGAYEFDVYKTNVCFSSLQFNILGSFCPGLEEVKVKIINKGTDTIKSVTAKLKVGTYEKSVSWNGVLASFDTSNYITIDTFNFEREQVYTLEYTLENPNGKPDEFKVNNTHITSGIKTKMTGDYTVYGLKSDYDDLGSAIAAVKSRGFCDTVRLKLRNGKYNGSWDLSGIKQKFPTDYLIIESESQDPQRCTLYEPNRNGTHVLRFSNTSGVKIQNISLQKFDDVYNGTLALLDNGSNKNISFENNIFIGNLLTPITLGVGTGSSLISSNTTSNNSRNDSIEIIKNIFLNNNGGIFFSRSINYQPETGLVIKDNKFMNQVYDAISLQNQRGTIITGNHIETERDTFYYKTNGPWAAINIIASKDLSINQNYVYRKNGWALRMEKDSGSSMQGTIINNVLISQTPLLFVQSKNFGFYFNTLRSIGDSTKLVINTSSARLLQLNNNIIYHENRGALYDSLNINFLVNNNVYYTQGKKLTLTDTSLAQIQLRGLDSNSIFYNPQFLTSKDCHISSDSVLFALGKDTIGIVIDMDGKHRDTLLTPGAYETVKVSYSDAGIIGVAPDLTCGYKPFIEFDLKNYSLSDTLYSAVVKYTINGVNEDSVVWKGKLAPGDTAKNIFIKRHVFDYDTLYTIKAWTVLPNFLPDIDTLNDTLTTTPKYYRLKGKYFIDGINPDFYTPNEAIDALYKAGVCGDVILELRKNRYQTTLLMNGMVKGMGNDYWVNIKGESPDSTDVEITFNYANTKHFELKDIKHIKISNLTLTTTSTYSANNQSTLSFNNSIGSNIIEGVWFGGITKLNGDSLQLRKSFFSEKSVLIGYSCNDLFVDNNDFWMAKVVFSNGQNTTFSNNVLFHGDSLHYNSENGYKIYNNHYFSETNLMAMLLTGCGPGTISKNKIFTWGNVAGYTFTDASLIHFDNTNGTAQNPVLVLNNIIYCNLPFGEVKGILAKESNFIDIFHNTIMLDSGANVHSEDMVMETKGSKNLRVANNLFVKRTGPSPAYIEFMVRTDSFNTFTYFDHNYYSVNDSLPHQFSYYKTTPNYISFQQWQDTSGFDLNSKWGKMPYFFPAQLAFNEINEKHRVMRWNYLLSIAGIFHEPFPYLNQNYNWTDRSGYNTGYNTDIFDNQRNIANPTFGAEEYLPQKTNAGIVGFDYPADNLCQGSNNIRIKLSNFGTDTLKSIFIKGKVRDSVINFHWSGTLAKGDTIGVTIANQSIARLDSLDILLWTENPNNLIDEYITFDTLKGFIYPSMNGTYTLGGTSPDYTSFQFFVDDLKRRGICGSVTLEVRPGKYEGQYIIPTINGSSNINTITVISSTRDSVSTVFSCSGTMNASNAYVVYLNNAKHWKFEYLGFINTQVGPNIRSRTVLMNNYVTDIEFNNCYISCYARTSASVGQNSLMQIGPDYLEDGRIGTVKVIACFFDGGAEGLSATLGKWGDVDTGIVRLVIDSCIFFQQINSVDILFPKNLTFSNNVIYGKPVYALQLTNMRDSLLVFNNRILDAKFSGMRITLTAKKGVQRIYNNEIIVKDPLKSSNSVGALYFSRVDGLEVVANSVHQSIAGYSNGFSYTAPWMVYVYRPYSLTLKNNLLTNKIGGRIFFADSVLAGTLSADYNLWDAGDTVGMYNQTFIVGHTAWTAQTGMDSNTIIDNIIYPDSNNLRYSNLNLKDKGIAVSYLVDDIDGVLRTSIPDIGCYEYGDAADIAVIGIEPATSCMDTVVLKTQLKNNSAATINFFEFEWSQNGSLPVKGSAKVTIAPGDTVDWSIGKVYIGKTSNNFKVTVTSVNYQYDLDTTNNSYQITSVYGAPQTHTLPVQKTVCSNDTVTLDPGIFAKYQWSTGDTTRVIKVDKEQIVYFSFIDYNGCINNDSIKIHFEKDVDLGNDTTRCDLSAVTLQVNGFNNYNWISGSTNSSITVNHSGNYWVKATTTTGCLSTDTILVNLSVVAPVIQKSNDTLFISNYDKNNTYNWLLNDTIIAGATDSFYKAIKGGSYTVTATDNNGVCISKSTQTPVNLSVNNLYKTQMFDVYPNPSNGILTISFKEEITENIEASVVDLLGREVYSETIMTSITQLNLEQLNAGVYQLILTNKLLKANVKILITK